MIKFALAVLLVCALIGTPALAAQSSSSHDEIRREIAALAERLQKLEAENAELKQRNDKLEKMMAAPAQAPAPAGASVVAAPVAAPTAVTPTARPASEVAAASDSKAVARPWFETLKVSGYVFGDAYAVPMNHDPVVEGANGFWIRRGYLTFDGAISAEWSSRLRFEVNSPGDFRTSARLTPFLKDAFLAWKRDGRELVLGLSPTPTWFFAEEYWGYRSLEKTPLDLYRMGNARDLGVAYRGTAHGGRVFYHAMFGNGATDGEDTNTGKRGMLALGFKPTDALVVELYGDYEDRPGNTDRTTYRGFVGWKGASSRYGLEYGWQQRDADTGPGETVSVASLYGVWGLTDKSTVIARWDRSFDGYSDADKIPYLAIATNTKFDLAILAWDYKLLKRISLIPNLEYVAYHETDGVPAPDDDLYARVTLYYQF